MQQSHNPLIIYLAEDDEDDRFLFLDALQRVHKAAIVDISSNGETFLEKIVRLSPVPDLVFLDVNMPKKNGLECLECLRANQKTRHIKIIILSTSGAAPLVEKARQLGADYYIQKPEDFGELERLLELCLQLTQAESRTDQTFLLNDMLGQQSH